MVAAHSQTRSTKNMADKTHSLSSTVAEEIVAVYTNTRSKFAANDHDHYQFNPRDLTLWVLQLLRYDIVSSGNFLGCLGIRGQSHFPQSFDGCRVTGPC